MDTVAMAVAGGCRAVVLREKDLPRPERHSLGARIGELLEPVGGVLIVASDAALAGQLGTEWVHLAAADELDTGQVHVPATDELDTGRGHLPATGELDTGRGHLPAAAELGTARGHVPAAGELDTGRMHLPAAAERAAAVVRSVGRSCHDAGEVRRAAAEGCAYVTVSPVFASASKPGYGPPLGVRGLARLVAETRGPSLYALGGVDASNAGDALRAGAGGVAVMGAIMGAKDPRAATMALVAACARAEWPG